MKKCTGFVFLMMALTGKGQDFAFSQFYEMPMLRNPALAGIFNGDIHVSSLYRSQWGSISVPFITAAIGAEYKIPASEQSNSYWTAGVQISYDKAGDLNLKKIQGSLIGTRHQSLSGNSDTYLSYSGMLGIVQGQFDPSAATLDDQFVNGSYSSSNVSTQAFPNSSSRYLDFSAGVALSSTFGEDSHYYLGVGLFHLASANVNYFASTPAIPLARKFIFNGGLSTPVNDHDQIIAYLDYYLQGGNNQLFGGALYESTLMVYDAENENDNLKISAGAFYRWNDALIPALKLQMHKLMIGVSYDINVSQLKTASQLRGGFELTLSFLGFLNNNNSSRNRVRCPGFGSSNRIGWYSSR